LHGKRNANKLKSSREAEAVQSVNLATPHAAEPVQSIAVPTQHRPWWHYSKIRRQLKKYRVAITVIVGVLVYLNREVIPAVRTLNDLVAPSSTRVRFSGATKTTLYIMLSNSGPKRSSLRSYRLRFLPLLNIDTVALNPGLPLKSEAIDARSKNVKFALTIDKLKLREPLTHRQYRREEVENYLCTAPSGRLRLEVDVQESNDEDGDRHIRHDDPMVKDLSTFVLGRMSSHAQKD
jgi:hypothetical protein